MTRFEDLLEGMRADLRDISVGVRWAWPAAYSVAGRGLDAVRGASLARSESEQDKGPTYDIALGDHACRVAVQRVGRYLGDTEWVLARARIFAGWRDWPRMSAEYVDPGEQRHLANLVLSLRISDQLIDDIELSYPTTHDLGKRKVIKEVGKGHEYLRHAVGGLDRALRRGEESQPSVDTCKVPMCIKPADPREAGVCSRCGRRKRRTDSYPTAAELARDEVEDRSPKQQQNKRRALGLDHGDESLSHAWRGMR